MKSSAGGFGASVNSNEESSRQLRHLNWGNNGNKKVKKENKVKVEREKSDTYCMRSKARSASRKGTPREKNLRRLESNERERKRMHSLNDAFQVLL